MNQTNINQTKMNQMNMNKASKEEWMSHINDCEKQLLKELCMPEKYVKTIVASLGNKTYFDIDIDVTNNVMKTVKGNNILKTSFLDNKRIMHLVAVHYWQWEHIAKLNNINGKYFIRIYVRKNKEEQIDESKQEIHSKRVKFQIPTSNKFQIIESEEDEIIENSNNIYLKPIKKVKDVIFDWSNNDVNEDDIFEFY